MLTSRFFKKKMSRAEAMMKAIDISDDGDSITLHSVQCTDPGICTCRPRMLYVGDQPAGTPIGFRMRDKP